MIVYALIDPTSTEIRYVGKTAKAPCLRLAQHLQPSALRAKNHKSTWLRKLHVSGITPELHVVETCDTVESLNESERFWISYFRYIGAALTNSTDGGDGNSPGYCPDARTRAKISAALKGRTPSETTRRNSSAARRGVTVSTHTREKLREARKGYIPTDETRATRRKYAGSRCRPVVDERGTVYKTITAAMRALKISRTSLWKHLNGRPAYVRGHTLRYL